MKMPENLLQVGMKVTNGRNCRQKEDGKVGGKQRVFFPWNILKERRVHSEEYFIFPVCEVNKNITL